MEKKLVFTRVTLVIQKCRFWVFSSFHLAEMKENGRRKKEIVDVCCCCFLEGDSGGPLMILNQTDHRWYLFGITSHGANSEQIKPGVYSSISTKLDFIHQYL